MSNLRSNLTAIACDGRPTPKSALAFASARLANATPEALIQPTPKPSQSDLLKEPALPTKGQRPVIKCAGRRLLLAARKNRKAPDFFERPGAASVRRETTPQNHRNGKGPGFLPTLCIQIVSTVASRLNHNTVSVRGLPILHPGLRLSSAPQTADAFGSTTPRANLWIVSFLHQPIPEPLYEADGPKVTRLSLGRRAPGTKRAAWPSWSLTQFMRHLRLRKPLRQRRVTPCRGNFKRRDSLSSSFCLQFCSESPRPNSGVVSARYY
jgi:hypothetical protein